MGKVKKSEQAEKSEETQKLPETLERKKSVKSKKLIPEKSTKEEKNKKDEIDKKNQKIEKIKTPKSAVFLENRIEMVLHTQAAQRLFNGDWRFGKMGLVQFAHLMNVLFKAYREDDPYAEWYLKKTYDAMEAVKEKLEKIEKAIDAQITSIRGFKISLMENLKPENHLLHFNTPFAFMGSFLLEKMDYLSRQVLTLRKIGLLVSEEYTLPRLIQEVEKVFIVARAWKHTGVTRQAIQENNKIAEKAKAIMGDVPESILKHTENLIFLPKIKPDNNLTKSAA